MKGKMGCSSMRVSHFSSDKGLKYDVVIYAPVMNFKFERLRPRRKGSKGKVP